jgi:TolB protein
MMTATIRSICTLSLAAALGLIVLAAPQDAPAPQAPAPAQQPSDITTTISGGAGAQPRLAVPDFIALSPDTETAAVAKMIAEVLYDDFAFEREFALIPRDTYNTIPAAKTFESVAFDRWRELNADGLLMGTVQKQAAGIRVEVRLFNVRTQVSAFDRRYDGSAANPRFFAHTIADEVHMSQRGLRGVARTKLAFASDRDGERMSGTVENRGVREIYISDYDGAAQRRVTTGKSLNIQPNWSPDGRSVAYTSYRRGVPNIFISHIYQGTLDEFPKSPNQTETFQPAWSPDGTKMAFWSTRDGAHAQLYVANRDGSNARRLMTSAGIDESPTWSPNGQQIAFVSDRTGQPQIYTIGADGLGLRRITTSESYATRPRWSPLPFNEIAYSARTGPGYDIKVLNLTSGQVRQLTFGEGTNESPVWAPNGRHLAFASSRLGKTQVFVMGSDGKNVKAVTTIGNNTYPDWSN